MLYLATTGVATLLSLLLWGFLCYKHYRLANELRQRPNSTGEAGPNDAQIIRDMIRHENDVTNHRLTWLLTLEGLLFAALAFSWGDDGRGELIFVLSVLGILVAGSAAIVLDAAHTAFIELDGWWNENRAKDYTGPDVCGFRGHSPYLGFFTPWRIVPPLFIVGWFVIMCLGTAR